jgi:CheY-like chemotaxis protein
MGGTIKVKSALGDGSEFTICLPLKCTQTTVGEVVQKNGTSNSLPDRSIEGKILLVEDQPSNVIVLSAFLEQFGYSYEVSSNGIEALEKVKEREYALIIMDVQMPGMNGLEAAQNIRAFENLAGRCRVPIIAMTAHASSSDRARCLAAGMDDYCPKPFDPNELREMLRMRINVKKDL